MDIARSIDFNNLDNLDKHVACPPSVPNKGHQIDVNREFNMYTTDSVSYPAEAPPIYQQDQSADPSWTSKPHPKFVLKTLTHNDAPTLGNPAKHVRHISEPRRSLQAPEIEPAPRPRSSNRPQEAPVHVGTKELPLLPETTILCQLPGASMDFTQVNESMPGRMGLTKGASTCTLRITLRKKWSASKGSRTVRSIWTIAADGKLCIQQKLPQDRETVPYTLWSNEKKVVIRQPTELRYYKAANSVAPYKTTETSWVTYSFESASQASDFQSSLLSPLQLIRSFPTSRTMRLHPSPFVRAFCPRLQLCGLENLRIFRDATDPNCLVCMIHYSPNFRPSNGDEYIIFRIYPPPRNSVRIREDGESCVKIKGLDIRGSPAGEQTKKGKSPQSQTERLEEEVYGSQSIEKMKIEFESGKEKREFLEMTRELQGLSSW
ncbi:MAG: hypothetical protein L6R38_008342 [Xanthoria sp. 2 TBL-2021]|nr:MAG: hypothetical protein L6R38_008342 [Xanthoria sp. 2 TBL-2021]